MPAVMQAPKLHTTRHDLPENVRKRVIEGLNPSLATLLDLKTQVKQAHWNVKGKDFYQLHELFDKLAEPLDEFVDLLAERATALGGTVLGTVRLAAKHSVLEEYPHDIFAGEAHLKALADRYAACAQRVREQIERCDSVGDADTADIYTEISRVIDQHLWFLEAHLQT